jgi:hypothetical protein
MRIRTEEEYKDCLTTLEWLMKKDLPEDDDKVKDLTLAIEEWEEWEYILRGGFVGAV